LYDPSLNLSPQSQLVFEPGSPISKFIDACSGKPTKPCKNHFRYSIIFLSFVEKSPLGRAQFLESTDLFTNIHAAAAASGQTAVPDNLDTDLHFTCFVQAPDASARVGEVATGERRLIELDGGRAGPVDRGKSTDLLKVR
jgi:ubiquitin carboxyl-terminal hydrolase L3